MKTITLNDIRNLKPEPCYDPSRYAPEDWSGTLLDILQAEQIPANDRVWVVTAFLDDRTNRLFAVWCARQALALIDKPDQRSIVACDVAEKFANGGATTEELKTASDAARAARAAASDAAWAAARDAASDAAWAAAWAAASDATWAAAWAAARDAARAAARAAARYAIRDAVRDAAWDAAMAAARDAAWLAASDAAWDAQIKYLIEMIETQE